MLFSGMRRTLPSQACYTFILFGRSFAAGCHRVSGGTGLPGGSCESIEQQFGMRGSN